MLVYVLNKDGEPLMPCKPQRARVLLKKGLAKVVNKVPFTIKLTYKANTRKQDITLGVDAGSKTVGLSATTKDKVLYENHFTLRNDIVELISTRREVRRSRKNRKTRYRKAKFDNRGIPKGWLAPSVKEKIESHLTIIRKVCELLPIAKIIVETASFDIQKNQKP